MQLNETALDVLARLQGGGFVSGQQMADGLGVSRSAIWKAVAALRQAGYIIDADPGHGYRLVFRPDPIEPQDVLARLQTSVFHDIRYIAETDTTNEVAKQLAKAGAAEGTVVLAEQQRQGRGRRGRSWETLPGQSLLFSIVLRPDIPPRKAPLLVFLAAAAVRSALLPYGETFIKWPNDVVSSTGRKLAGILVELDAEHDRVRHCIVGIGINVNQRPRDFAPHLQPVAGSVAMLQAEASGAGHEEAGTAPGALPPIPRGPLLAATFDEFARRYVAALEDGFAGVLDETRRHSATLGRAVRVQEPKGEIWYGTAVDLHTDGALLVRPEEAGRRRADGSDLVPIYAAEVSIRMEESFHEPY